jgi:predicted dehydrogenase
MVFRAALVGCGKIGSEYADDPRVEGIYSHAGAYIACPATRLVAVCDRDEGKLDRCGERWGVPGRYGEARQMLAEQTPEIVSVCTPDPTHYEMVRVALEAPATRAVLAEKPLALELKQARELVQLAAERSVLLVVNYSRRFAPSHVQLREYLHGGAIGAIQTVGGYYTKGTLHNGTHWFDLVRFLVGEVARVWGADIRKEGGDDPTLDAFLELDCGASAFVHGCASAAFTLFEMDLIGTRGRVRVTDSGHTVETYEVRESLFCPGLTDLGRTQGLPGGFRDVLLHAVEDVVRCLTEGGRPRCSGADGVAAIEIALAIRESARSGLVVCLGGAP